MKSYGLTNFESFEREVRASKLVRIKSNLDLPWVDFLAHRVDFSGNQVDFSGNGVDFSGHRVDFSGNRVNFSGDQR